MTEMQSSAKVYLRFCPTLPPEVIPKTATTDSDDDDNNKKQDQCFYSIDGMKIGVDDVDDEKLKTTFDGVRIFI